MMSAVICPQFCFVVISGIVTDGSNEMSSTRLMRSEALTSRSALTPIQTSTVRWSMSSHLSKLTKGARVFPKFSVALKVRIGFCDSDLVRL